jgi:hypothetical protein
MNDLTQHLARRADEFERQGGTPLHLDQVLDRAGEIRRGRRLRATLVMAAAVLAIALPVGIVSLDRGHRDEVQPAPPSRVDRSALTLDGLGQGDAPAVAYLQSGALHKDGHTYGSRVEHVVGVAEAHHVTVLAARGADGNITARALDGRTSWPMSGDFTVSADGSLVAFVEPDGTPVVVTADGVRSDRRSYTLPRIPRGSGFDAVAVDGQACRTTGELPCRVWVRSTGAVPENWVSTSGGTAARALPGLRSVTDVDNTGTRAAGVVDVHQDLTTCSAVVEPARGRQTWATCDHRLLAFSPDGSRLLATASVGDGLGDTELAVLDAATGEVQLDLRTADRVVIGRMVWEDDSHVLATVFQDGRWAVLRIGLDGRREIAVPPVRGPDESPFVLPSR